MAVAFFVADRATAECDAVLKRALNGEAHLPAHWALEVANARIKSARRLRLPEAATHVELLTVEALTARSTVQPPTAGSLRVAFPMAIERDLSSYGAVDLELATRLGLPLATWDRALARAAASCGVATFPETTRP